MAAPVLSSIQSQSTLPAAISSPPSFQDLLQHSVTKLRSMQQLHGSGNEDLAKNALFSPQVHPYAAAISMAQTFDMSYLDPYERFRARQKQRDTVRVFHQAPAMTRMKCAPSHMETSRANDTAGASDLQKKSLDKSDAVNIQVDYIELEIRRLKLPLINFPDIDGRLKNKNNWSHEDICKYCKLPVTSLRFRVLFGVSKMAYVFATIGSDAPKQMEAVGSV
jgi:hypothetical protein